MFADPSLPFVWECGSNKVFFFFFKREINVRPYVKVFHGMKKCMYVYIQYVCIYIHESINESNITSNFENIEALTILQTMCVVSQMSQQSMNSSLVLNHVLTHVYKRLLPEDDTRVVYKHIFKKERRQWSVTSTGGAGWLFTAHHTVTHTDYTLTHVYTQQHNTRAAKHALG